MRLTMAIVFSIVVFTGCSTAAELPKSAKPLSAEEVKEVYSSKTAVWSKDNAAFFASDGSVKGVYGGGYFSGTWDVSDNEVCMRVQGTDAKTKKSDGKTYVDCWKWFRDGKKRAWAIWSVHHDGSTPSKRDYSTEEIEKLKSGDLVTEKYEKAKNS